MVLGGLAAPLPVHAGGGVLDAADALARARAGALTIVDIRTVQEWAETGVPENGTAVSLMPRWGVLNASFVDDVLAAVGSDKTVPNASICARGNRSSGRTRRARTERLHHGLQHLRRHGRLGVRAGLAGARITGGTVQGVLTAAAPRRRLQSRSCQPIIRGLAF